MDRNKNEFQDHFFELLRAEGLTDDDLQGAVSQDFLNDYGPALFAFDVTLTKILSTGNVEDMQTFLSVCRLLISTAVARHRAESAIAAEQAEQATWDVAVGEGGFVQ